MVRNGATDLAAGEPIHEISLIRDGAFRFASCSLLRVSQVFSCTGAFYGSRRGIWRTGREIADWGWEMGSGTRVLTEGGGAERNCASRYRPPALALKGEEEQLLLEHLPMVRFLARRIHERLPSHVDLEDLVSAGVLGLIDAFQKFDPEKNVQFRSYAQFRIRGAILDSLRTLDWSPRDLRRKGRAMEDAVQTLTARLGRAPAEAEVAAEMGLKLGEYQQFLGSLKSLEIGTLNATRNEDSSEEELEHVPGRPEEDPLFQCLKGEMRDRLAKAILRLSERERLVITLYYHEEMTMREIALALMVVESRVSQIHASAIAHLRATLTDLVPWSVEDRRGRPKAGRLGPA